MEIKEDEKGMRMKFNWLSCMTNKKKQSDYQDKILLLEAKIAKLENTCKKLINDNRGYINKLKKVTPKPNLHFIAIHLAEHCNLNCFSCDNFSQLANEGYCDIEVFENDIKRLYEISKGNIEQFRLSGGEPLLNKNCKDYFYILRKYFKNSSIWLLTNGILLLKQDAAFWKACKENGVSIRPTKYPIKLDWDKIKSKCIEFGIELQFFNNEKIEKTSFKTALNLRGGGRYF
ncbi:hypothetical protein B6S12_10405 [Helicobacter valdiviensis]|uniref:Radical SAM core domain-containing protein n=1 Tax=Helicobacter valdiviensis TaxID=1458358 RepID=A0A2W6MRK3_9HELI|nr:radical SAM protein [Helicobacter valdiviensis]PZT47185.1 hypothetical protein B6S12_10405 [Helicobacter valdiviensis]